MRRALSAGLIWILFGVTAIIVGQILLLRNQNLGPELALKREAGKIEKIISKAIVNINQYKPAILNGSAKLDLEEPAIQDLKGHGIDLFVFTGNEPKFWTTHAFNMTPRFSQGVEIQKHASRYFVLWTYIADSAEYTFTKEIIANPEFKSISSGTIEEEQYNKFSISVNPVETSVPLEVAGLPLFYVVIEQFSSGVFSDLLILFGFLIVSIGIFMIFRKTDYWYLFYILNIFLWVVVEFSIYQNVSLWNLKTIPIFAPEVYASSWYFPNLGTFLYNLILIFIFVLFLQQLGKRLISRIGRFGRFGVHLLFIVISILFAGFLLVETGNLVRDSSVTFDFHEIHLISIYTIVGLVSVSVGFGSLFILLRIVDWFKPLKRKKIVFFLVQMPILFTISYCYFKNYPPVFWVILFLFMGVYFVYQSFFQQWRPWYYLALGLITPAIAVGVVFNFAIAQKEIELREILAAKLLLQSEREPSSLLQRTETKLLRDKGVGDYYKCLDESKSDFDKRLRQLYFAEYSENYEILVYDFNTAGYGYRVEHAFTFFDLNNLYNSNSCKPVTSHFSIVNDRKLKGSFLGKFLVTTDSNSLLGMYFVLLKPRVTVAQGSFSDVFNKSPLESLFKENQYSYAFYSSNKLSRRFGQYYYPNSYNFKGKKNPIEMGGFSHFNYSDDLGNFIVISKPLRTWLESLTAYTILGLSCLVVGMLYLFFILIWQYLISIRKTSFTRLRLLQFLQQQIPTRRGSDLFLSSKLQLYVTMVVFATFIVVLFVTINYFRNSYTHRQREFLWNKTNQIANAIGTQANLDALFNKYQTGLVYDLSDYYTTDINIYNANGKLLVSSNDRIYDQDLLGSLMNPLAYRDFTKLGISGFIKEEKVGDLKYISAYYTIFDNDLNVKGFLNLPYFTNRQDLYRELSNYASTIINLFALVFAIAALVAYVIAHRITEPLNLIRHQMGLVKLGAKNAPIQWQLNDEIGLLIVEYNKMINELDLSSNRLAESEREGAWREMAKQVAHEIKNPLTPMKLSLQHLQYAMQRKDENIEEKIKKTSELLINQIDSLSRMAEEFSSFAKMPDAKTEQVSLNEVLDEVVSLFSKEINLSIEYKPLPHSISVFADKHQLNRVFTNVIKNAAQAIPEGRKGKLRIYGDIADGKAIVYFEDNGKGIQDELKGKIFSPNFSTKNSGMGLGLAISRKNLEQFQGEIDFTSEDNKGTTFFVKLPIAEPIKF